MKRCFTGIIKRYSVALGWAYFTILFSWLVLHLLSGDRFSLVGLANNFAIFLFFPLPLFGLLGLITHRKELIGGTFLGAAVFLWFWGGIFIPNVNPPKDGNPYPELTVMTYNMLSKHGYVEPAIEVIHQEKADVVLLQELTPDLAQAMQTELITMYPYQILDPQPSVSGMGTLSRYPIADTGARLELDWVGTPQILKLDFEGLQVTLVNFHSLAYAFNSLATLEQEFRQREAQAKILADFATNTTEPLIAGGDANTSDISQSYRTIRAAGLQDVWRAAGFGLGGTFPGSSLPESSRWQIGPWYTPQWMLRIDYIFVSPHWQVQSAKVAQFDGVSDHRGVVAELVFMASGR